ncbi:YhjD/YihY/BrkB family envelope integrity protein [Streptomyces sp. NPDC019507]|uniref:YhjD/YihY/BrkB family envelope integrity protein n=1 Tax=Streptomyces sp. NPDC019507 TaxID=3154689 RepID=UPI0033D94510
MTARRRAPLVLRPSWWSGRFASWGATARSTAERTEARFPVLTHLTARMISVNILDSATRLAAQCFLTAVPLLFVVGSFAPKAVRDQLISSVSAIFGLTGASQDLLEQVYRSTDDNLREATGLIGALMVLLSATACSRAMQRLCKRAWRVPRSGVRIAAWRWLAWIGVWLSVLLIQGPVREGFGVGLWLAVPVTMLSQILLWWWSQHLLLGGLVGWRPLLPGAVLTGFAVTALFIGSKYYMPRAIDRSLAEYGSVGTVFTLLSWLIVLCVAIALGVTTGAVLATEAWLARRLGDTGPRWAADDAEPRRAEDGPGPRRGTGDD